MREERLDAVHFCQEHIARNFLETAAMHLMISVQYVVMILETRRQILLQLFAIDMVIV